MRKLWVFLSLLSSLANAYSVVTISTSAPVGIEGQFLAATAAQFNTAIVPNPFFPNTFAVQLFGLNPLYQAPSPPPTTLQDALSLGATVYVYGFANGMTYQQQVSQGIVGNFGNLCAYPTSFMLAETNSGNFDKGTCLDTITTIMNAFFNLSVSTPTVLPPEP